MRHLCVTFIAFVGPVVALVNNSLPQPGKLAVNPQTATGGGWDNLDDEDSFPADLLDDEHWENFKCKGQNLVTAMHSSNSDAAKLYKPIRPTAESPWDDSGALTTWNWRLNTDSDDLFANFLDQPEEHNGEEWGGLGLEAALEELGLPLYPGNDPKESIKIVYLNHFDIDGAPLNQQTYDVRGKTLRATGGHYKFGIETSTGAMFSLLLLAPAEASKERKPPIPKEGLPELQRASDLAWLSWVRFAEPKNNLKYFFNVAIANEQTQQAVRRVLKNTDTAFGPWPGVTFDTDTDEGKVLLGTPNGRGHGYFLAQHKAALGNNMYISKIQVFHGATAPFTPNMVLHVEQEQPTTMKRALRKGKGHVLG